MKLYAILYLLLFVVPIRCSTIIDDRVSLDKPGKRLFYSLLKPIIAEANDTLYEGTYAVYENKKLKGHKINLYVLVIPARSKDSLQSPIFYFQGGPGDAATAMKNFFLRNKIYREKRDIVLIDFRGTGQSNPLHCDGTQLRTTAQACMDEMFPIDSVRKCFKELSAIADLSQYTTEIAIDDVEEIRKWLGYDAINIMGQSYGTRSCQSYMRLYPHSIRSVVMIGPVPTSMNMPLNHAYDGQRAWSLLLEDCKNDSACNVNYPLLAKEFNSLIERLRKKPDNYIFYDSIKHTREKVFIKHGPFADLLRSIMYSPKGQRQIPYLVHEANKGNYQPLIEIAIDRNSEPYSLADGFYLCVTCSEDVPYIDSMKTPELTMDTYMGNYRIQQQIAACSTWRRNQIGNNFRDPVESAIPALVISGMHDPITPPRWGDSVTQNMSNAKQLIIPAMAHGIRGLSNDTCFYNLINRFISSPHEKISSEKLVLMKPPVFR
jgi:pimeloyl-ACP methyl ester carboxylesterase